MWIRLIDNSNPLSHKVFEYAEGVLSTCDYRIHNNGRLTITLHKEGYSPESNLERAMISLIPRDYFDVELYSGTTIVKSAKCKIHSYSMGTGEAGALRERAELDVLTDGVDYNSALPTIVESIYDVQRKVLTVFASDIIQDSNGGYSFDLTRMAIFNVALTQSSMVKTVQRNTFAIQISDDDSSKIEASRKLGAVDSLKVFAGWNTSRSQGAEITLKVIDVVATELGSTEGLSN